MQIAAETKRKRKRLCVTTYNELILNEISLEDKKNYN